MATGSNELNMLLKARVVKIRVELDYRGSNLPKQVNDITRFLKDKPVKLKIKFDVTQKALNEQLRAVNARILANKAIKPVKVRVELDKDSTGRIKQQFDQISRAITEFNKKYSQQVKQMENNKKRADRAVLVGGNVPTSAPVQNFNNIKQYTRQLEQAEKILRSKLPTGQNGLFSSVQMKDAKGNLQGFIASLTKASGVVEQVHYKWNAKKDTFSPVSRKTLDNSQKSLQETSVALKALHTQIKTLEKGTGKSNLFKEYDALAQRMKNGTMNGSAIKNLQNMIKEEQNLQKHVDRTNKEYAEQQALIRKITKARDADYKSTMDTSRRKQYNNLLGDVKNQRRDLKLIKTDLDAINNVVDISNRKEKELNANTKKRLAVMQQLRVEANKAVSSDKTSQRLLREITLMTRRAKTARDYIDIQRKMSQLKVSNYNDTQISKSIAMQDKIQAHLRTLVNTGKMTAQQFDRAMQQLPRTAARGNADLNRQLSVLTRTVKRNADAMKAEANKMKTIFAGGTGNADSFKKLMNQGDIVAVQKRMGEVLKGTVQTITVAENKTDRYGNAVTELKVKMQSAGKQAQTYTMQMNRATGALSQVGSGLEFNANRNLGIFEQLRIAMARVPIWMTAMTAFYGSIRVVRNAVNEILLVDKALTEIKRVASDNINIDTMFQGSVDLSKELGNNIHEILNSVAELSRTFGEMNERQLLSITRTGTLMANVSDLNAEEAVQSLVGTMNAFNIEAEESIRIVDSLNEVDNNFAISTKQLSEGLSKSASTAKTFGVTMEESIGHITAIGSVTMESGRLIGNSLKTIYSRVTTLGASEEILSSVGVAVKEIGENGEEVRPVNDILKDLSLRWNTINDSQRQNIAVTVAGRYQLSRFLALMNNYDTALDATNTAVYSQGSAMRENAEYMKSFEARINQMKNGFTELAEAVGDAILKSSMMEIIRLFTSFAEVAIKVSNSIGVLPVLLGGLAVVLLKMKVFSTWTASMVRGLTGMSQAYIWTAQRSTMLGSAMARTSSVGAMSMGMLRARVTASLAGISAAFTAATGAVRGFTVAFRTMLASTVIGIAFVALGFAIEKLMKVYNEKKQKEEELIKLNKKMIEGYRDHRDGMGELLARHDELREKTNRSADEEREYLGLQKQLAEQIPTTVSYIDANGNAHMKTTEEIKKEVEAVKQLSIQEAKLTSAKFHENMAKKADSYLKITENIEELNKKQKELEENDGKNAWTNGHIGTDNMWDALLSTNPYLDNKVHIEQNKVDILMAEAEKTGAIQQTIQAVQAQATAYFEAGNKMSAIGDSQQAMIESFIGQNEAMLRNADTAEEFEQAYKDLFEIGVKAGDVFVEAFDIMSKDIDDPLELQALQKSLGDVANSIPKTFMVMEDEFGNVVKTQKEVEDGLKEIINVSQHVAGGADRSQWKTLEGRLRDVGLTADQSKIFLKDLANEHDNAGLKAEAQAQGVDGLSSSIEDMNEQAMEAIDLTASLFGYSGTELEGMKSHLQMLHLLRDTMGEAGKETDEYKDSQMALADFLGVTTEELEKNESKYYEIIEALSAVDLTAYDPSTSWTGFIDSQEIDDNMKALLKSWDGTKNILTGEKNEIVDNNKAVKKSVEDIKDVFTDDITENAVAGALKDTRKEAEDDDWAVEYVDNIKNIFKDADDGTLFSWASGFLSPDMEAELDDTTKKFQKFFDELPGKLSSGWNNFGKSLDDSMGNIPTKAYDATVEYAKKVGDWFSAKGDAGSAKMDAWSDSFTNWMNDLPEKSSLKLEEWYFAIKEWFKTTGSDWSDNFNEWGEETTEWFTSVPDVIKAEMKKWGKAIQTFFSSDDSVNWKAEYSKWGNITSEWYMEQVQVISDNIKEWWKPIGEWFDEKSGMFTGKWSEWGTGISDWYSEMVDEISTGIEEWWNPIGEWFDDLVPNTVEKLIVLSGAIVQWFKDQNEENKEFFGQWWEEILTDFEEFPAKFTEKMSEWGQAIKDWFGKGNDVKDGLDTWVNESIPTFGEMKDKVTGKLDEMKESITAWFDEDIAPFWNGFNAWGDRMLEWFTGVPDVIKEKLTEWKDAVVTYFEENGETLWNGFNDWGDRMVEWFNGVPETIKSKLSEWTSPISDWFTENDGTLWDGFNSWGDRMVEWFDSVPDKIREELGKWKEEFISFFTDFGSGEAKESSKPVGEQVVDGIVEGYKVKEDDILSTVSKTILKLPLYVIGAAGVLVFGLGREIVRFISDGMADNRNKTDFYDSAVGKLVTWIDEALSPYRDSFVEWGKDVSLAVAEGIGYDDNKKDFYDSAIGKLVTGIDDTLSPHRDKFVAWGKRMTEDMGDGISSNKKKWKDRWEGLKEIAKESTLEMIKDIAIMASGLPEKMGNAIDVAKTGIRLGIHSMINDMASALETGLNGVIKAVNKVLSYINVDSFGLISIPRAGGGGKSAPRNNMGMGVQAYAKGTKNKTHQGGHALVGEEGHELAHIPNVGMTLLGKHGAEILDLPKGTSVLPHKQTQQMLQSYNFPAYALGVGDFFKDVKQGTMGAVSKGAGYVGNVLEAGKDVFSGATSSLDSLFNKFAETPRKIIEALLSGVSNSNGRGGLSGDMFGGAISTVKSKAMDFATKQIKELFGSGGNIAPNFGGLRMTSPFGWRTHPIFGDKRFHAGVDYAGALGTPLASQTGGKVTFSGASGNGFGNLVKVKNGAFEYFYAHLQKAMAGVGSMVRKGQTIGTLGSTGDSTGPHVHYEVRKNGKAIAPQGFEIGGKVSKEQIIRVGEGDKEEMIIPLEQHKSRAVALWKEAGERLGQFQYFAKGGTVSGSGSSYKVKYGDTLSELAVKFKTTVKSLMALNSNITNANKIYAGNTLKLGGSSSGGSKAPAPKPFSIPLTAEQQVSKWQSQIALTEQQMQKITEHSDKYRNKMKEIVTFETHSLKYQKQILATTEKRQKTLLSAMSKSPKKKTEEQQEKYDSWKQEYDSNIEKIQGMKVEIEGLTNTIKDKTLAIFTNLVDGIIARAENRMNQFAKVIDDIDFKIQVADLTEPENTEKRLELQAERAVKVKQQQNEVLQLVKEIESNYRKVVKANGANSEQAKRWRDELDAVKEQYEDITIEALQAEKAVKDARQEIADKGIEQLKKYYGQAQDLATQAIDAEKEQLQKAHDEKMKLYDKESERISTLYDEKLQAMDKEKSDTEYLDELNEKNANKAELLNKISVLSRDTSVEGRKKVAELQKELTEMNKDIADFQKERQDSLLREALEKQKQDQLDAIEAKKEEAEVVLQFGEDKNDDGVGGLTGLDAEKEAMAKKYDDIINNEQHWAEVRDAYTKGSFAKLNAELSAMYANVDAMNKGNFGTISDSFNNLSDSAKAELISNNQQDVANTKYQNDALKDEVDASQTANTDLEKDTKQGRLLTGYYKAKASAERTKKIIEEEYSGKNTKLVPVKEGWKVQADFSSESRATQIRDYLKQRKILSVGHVSSFDTGGYTGEWGKSGKLAVLHEKEIVLKKDDTRNILDATKIIKSVSHVLPQIKRSSISEKLATADGVNINNHYELNVHIDNLNGDKKGAETVAKTVMKGLKKMGKR